MEPEYASELTLAQIREVRRIVASEISPLGAWAEMGEWQRWRTAWGTLWRGSVLILAGTVVALVVVQILGAAA